MRADLQLRPLSAQELAASATVHPAGLIPYWQVRRETVANADQVMSQPAPAPTGASVQRCGAESGDGEAVQGEFVQRQDAAPPEEEPEGEAPPVQGSFVQRQEDEEAPEEAE